MTGDENAGVDGSASDHDLYLVEIPNKSGEAASYLVCQRIITVDPKQSAMGVPWQELSKLFEHRFFKAVPMPGTSARRAPLALKRTRDGGVSTEPGVSTFIEINVNSFDR